MLYLTPEFRAELFSLSQKDLGLPNNVVDYYKRNDENDGKDENKENINNGYNENSVELNQNNENKVYVILYY